MYVSSTIDLFKELQKSDQPADNVRLTKQVNGRFQRRVEAGETTCTCAWTSAWSNVCCYGAVLTVTLMSSWLRKPAD